jgi:hypothetical protein
METEEGIISLRGGDRKNAWRKKEDRAGHNLSGLSILSVKSRGFV